MLDSIFLDPKSDILLRKIKQPDAKSNAGATLIYIRTPSSPSPSSSPSFTSFTSSNSQSQDHPIITKWPYTKHDQPILLQISTTTSIPYYGTKNVIITIPTLALLSTILLSPSLSTSLFHLPTVIVHSQVSKYLCRGAHLMRSGMISIHNVSFNNNNSNNNNNHNHNKNNHHTVQWVCIQVQNNPQPFAIGLLTNNTTHENILGCDNNKGIGVEIITCYGDDIYQSQVGGGNSRCGSSVGVVSSLGGGCYDNGHYGNIGFHDGKYVHGLVQIGDEEDDDEMKSSPNSDHQDTSSSSADGDDGDNGSIKAISKLNINDEEKSHENDSDLKLSCTNNNGEKVEENVVEVEEQEGEEASTLAATAATAVGERDEHEENLFYAFHTSLLTISKKDLPMAVSTFYSQHVLPARREGSFLDIKQTKYRKIGTFLMEQSKNRDKRSGMCIISIGSSKDKKDPVAFLTGIDRSHCDLRDAKRRRKEQLGGGTLSVDGSIRSKAKLAVVNLYVIPNSVATLMRLHEDAVKAVNAKSEERRGTGFLTTPECREILYEYIVENELIDAYDPENVSLDGPLCDVLFKKSKKQSGGNTYNDFPESITRKDLNEKWFEKMDNAYAIVSMPGSVIIGMKRGKPPMVSIEVEARQSRKKFVTRVRGLEDYAITVSEFANDVSKRFACSASIEDEHSLSAGRPALKKGRAECVFQGHLAEELQALLLGSGLSSHGGTKDSTYSLPKGIFDVILKKGVPKRKR